jgi:Transport and Golgi organisation 2
MCTVTYLPLGDNRFMLTSNRDEQAVRPPALPPDLYEVNGIHIMFPKDTLANGTWIASAENGFSLVLLNGAFESHLPQPPYRRSRGLMLLDFFNFNDVKKFASDYNFSGIQPFTLLILNESNKLTMSELRWDGENLHFSEPDALQSRIWSSATLYPAAVQLAREQWFAEWLAKHPAPDLEDVLHFHHFGGSGDVANDLLMHRPGVFTVSITVVSNRDGDTEMNYEDLIQNHVQTLRPDYAHLQF